MNPHKRNTYDNIVFDLKTLTLTIHTTKRSSSVIWVTFNQRQTRNETIILYFDVYIMQ